MTSVIGGNVRLMALGLARCPQFFFALALLLMPFASPQAEEVTTEVDRLVLSADFDLADGKTISDPIILISHALLQHKRQEAIRVFSELFRENGYSTLAMTFSAGISNRQGPYDCTVPHLHMFEDHVREMRTWIAWLKNKGAEDIIVAGHSGGANTVARLQADPVDPIVTKAILFAPGTSDHFARSPEGYSARYRKDIKPILEKAKSLISAGKGNTLLEDTDFLFCPRTSVSAHSLVSYYGDERRTERLLPKLMQSLSRPTLLVAASEDNIAPDLTRLVKPFIDDNRLSLKVIEGCGHFFRDLCADDAVDAAVEFLTGEAS